MKRLDEFVAAAQAAQAAVDVLCEPPALDQLRAFAQALFSDWPEHLGVDGFELQELAEKHGLLVATEVAAPCHPDCWCEQYNGGDGFPAICYRKTATLTGCSNDK